MGYEFGNSADGKEFGNSLADGKRYGWETSDCVSFFLFLLFHFWSMNVHTVFIKKKNFENAVSETTGFGNSFDRRSKEGGIKKTPTFLNW